MLSDLDLKMLNKLYELNGFSELHKLQDIDIESFRNAITDNYDEQLKQLKNSLGSISSYIQFESFNHETINFANSQLLHYANRINIVNNYIQRFENIKSQNNILIIEQSQILEARKYDIEQFISQIIENHITQPLFINENKNNDVNFNKDIELLISKVNDFIINYPT